MKQMLFPTLVALSLTGCAATSDLPTGYALTPGQPEGLLIVSLTLSGEPLEKISSFEYRIRALAPEEREAVIARPYFESVPQHARGASRTTARAGGGQEIVVKGPSSAEPLDLWEGATAGRVASLRLPPGAYEFYTWQLRDRAEASGGTEYSPKRPFSYRFVIKPGQATYIGQLNLDLREWKAQKITVEDRRERDLALLNKRMPSIGSVQVSSEVGQVHP